MMDDKRTGTTLNFEIEEPTKSIIKVIGVGGGGGNAVNHMYEEGIHDVSFLVTNLDQQALNASKVPMRLQLGTEGLGAGNVPAKARQAAEETIDKIKHEFDDGTKMVFITASMGGGTGTGAAPVIARVAKELGILTVGIVTIPFLFEGNKKIDQALDGVEEISKHVDALLVINNERLRDLYPDFTVMNALKKADDILCVAAKSIAEIITIRGVINLDYNDVRTVLKDGGVAIMSMGYGEGEGRVKKAIENALNSPLLNESDIFNSKKILLSLAFSGGEGDNNDLMMDEMNDVNEFMSRFNSNIETKWGLTLDRNLGEKVKVTILATGFGINRVDGMDEHIGKRTREQEEELQRQEEERVKNTNRKIRYYGGNTTTTNNKLKPNIYIFGFDELDNEEIINAVESSPTYTRTRPEVQSFKNLGKPKPEEPKPAEPQNPIQGTINF